MTNEWTAARLLGVISRCDAMSMGSLTASAGSIWPDPDPRPREDQAGPVAVCCGPNSAAFALAEFFAAASADLPAAVAWTGEVCEALGCAPEDVVEKVRKMVARLKPIDAAKGRWVGGQLSAPGTVLTAPYSCALGDDGCGCEACNTRQP